MINLSKDSDFLRVPLVVLATAWGVYQSIAAGEIIGNWEVQTQFVIITLILMYTLFREVPWGSFLLMLWLPIVTLGPILEFSQGYIVYSTRASERASVGAHTLTTRKARLLEERADMKAQWAPNQRRIEDKQKAGIAYPKLADMQIQHNIALANNLKKIEALEAQMDKGNQKAAFENAARIFKSLGVTPIQSNHVEDAFSAIRNALMIICIFYIAAYRRTSTVKPHSIASHTSQLTEKRVDSVIADKPKRTKEKDKSTSHAIASNSEQYSAWLKNCNLRDIEPDLATAQERYGVNTETYGQWVAQALKESPAFKRLNHPSLETHTGVKEDLTPVNTVCEGQGLTPHNDEKLPSQQTLVQDKKISLLAKAKDKKNRELSHPEIFQLIMEAIDQGHIKKLSYRGVLDHFREKEWMQTSSDFYKKFTTYAQQRGWIRKKVSGRGFEAIHPTERKAH